VPAWLLWLLPVPLATVGAICWTAWTGRRRGPEQVQDSVAAHQRFREALAAPPRDGGPGSARLP
jgi:cytochrome c-type biogenesis protein CcmH/NrfF